MSNVNLVLVDGVGLSYLETVEVPDGTVQAVEVLIQKALAPNAIIRPELLSIARQITTEFPVYLCGNFAMACLIGAGGDKYVKSFEPLYRAWIIGERAIATAGVRHLRASLSRPNASFLSAGAQLARYYVWKGKLEAGFKLANMVVALDGESSTQARFVQAHIHHLLGLQDAVDALKALADRGSPMAYYTLGLEHLRRRNNDAARHSFLQGYRRVPEVASILLGKTGARSGSRARIREAESYVETFCLSEWRSDELAQLGNLLAATDASS
ncbi:MAG: hypothetical protein PSV26_02985 [Polaromonas sp.]|uniref:hypothetical protein n=1 Tax=Polaromonas sp. TaxID=1869339 RepID=UPI00248A2484|nr:hypothetical protein [Polaromonas sp.]MDI1236431.1 hypothetical protein [Polaromonas sp.]